ncbi:MAG: nuclear transport factor 2 family protein [Sphingomicrobium sp.]
MRTSVIILALFTTSACQQTPKGERPPVTETQAIKIAEAAESTFTGNEPDRIMDQYVDGAVMIDAATANPSTDRKVQSGWAKTFVSMKPADFRVTDRHVQIVGPDAFVSSGVENFTVSAGTARPVVSARFTDVFQRQKDGRWKIVHEHISMPPAPTGTAG